MSTFDFEGLIKFLTAIFNAMKDLYEMLTKKDAE